MSDHLSLDESISAFLSICEKRYQGISVCFCESLFVFVFLYLSPSFHYVEVEQSFFVCDFGCLYESVSDVESVYTFLCVCVIVYGFNSTNEMTGHVRLTTSTEWVEG